MIDAPAPGPVSVLTQTRFPSGPPPFTPLGNISVFAIRPDGTLADMQTTDATAGTATVQAYDGDSVTALYPHMGDAGADLTTFMGVKHGDSLTFGLRFSPNIAATTLGQMTITMPAIANSNYYIYTPCGGYGLGTTNSGTITEYNYCHKDPFDIMVVARDASTGTLTQSGVISDVTFASGGSASLTTWHPATTTKLMQVTGLPADVTNVSMYDYDVLDDTYVVFANSFGGAPSNNQYTTPTYQWPGTGTREWVRTQMNRQGAWTTMFIYDNVTPTTQSYTLAAPQLPPWITSQYVVSAGAQMAAWFPVGDGPSKVTVARFTWTHSSAPYSWTFVLPPGMTAVNFPKLPDSASMNAPHPEDVANVNFIRTYEIPELASYEDVKKLPESTLVQLDVATEMGVLKRVIGNQ